VLAEVDNVGQPLSRRDRAAAEAETRSSPTFGRGNLIKAVCTLETFRFQTRQQVETFNCGIAA
jgi:hypothetical protein